MKSSPTRPCRTPRGFTGRRRRPAGRLSVADGLRRWSERLCFVTELTPQGLADAVELEGELEPELDWEAKSPDVPVTGVTLRVDP